MQTNIFRIKDLIQCPNCLSEKLIFDESKIVCDNCKSTFKVVGEVPVLLTDKEAASKKSDVHNTFGTTFNYIDHYEKDALEFDYFEKQSGAVKHNERRVREYISSMVSEKSGLILDVGCGSAWVAKNFSAKGYKVVSFDISLKNTSEALKRFPSENHSAVVGDVFSLPFKKNLFDVIIASEIIEHVTEPGLFVESLSNVLKPGGSLIITTPYKEKIEYSLCIHCNKPTPKSAHLHSFDEKKLLLYFDRGKFEKASYFKFANKALIFLRTHLLLKILPFIIWKFIDRLANFIYKRPLSILIKANKKLV